MTGHVGLTAAAIDQSWVMLFTQTVCLNMKLSPPLVILSTRGWVSPPYLTANNNQTKQS